MTRRNWGLGKRAALLVAAGVAGSQAPASAAEPATLPAVFPTPAAMQLGQGAIALGDEVVDRRIVDAMDSLEK